MVLNKHQLSKSIFMTLIDNQLFCGIIRRKPRSIRTVPDPILIFPAILFFSFSQDPMLPVNNPIIMRNIIVIKAKNEVPRSRAARNYCE
jgi:hypothetical protein